MAAEEELESEAPADVAATHGPDATAIAAAEEEVDLDTVSPQHAQADTVPAGVPVEPMGAVDNAESPSEGEAPVATTEEDTSTA